MVMEEAPVQVVEVAWSELTEHFKLILLDCFEDILVIMGREKAKAGLASRALPRFSLTDRQDVVEVSSYVEAAHGLETLWILNTHFKVDLRNLQPLIHVVNRISLLLLNLHRR